MAQSVFFMMTIMLKKILHNLEIYISGFFIYKKINMNYKLNHI